MPIEPAIDDQQVISRLEAQLGYGLIPRCGDTTGPPCGEEQHRCVRFAGHDKFWLDHRAEDGTTW